MPGSCGYAWSTQIDSIIREESEAAGVPLDLAYTFIAAESGFDPNAHALTAIEDSVGLLQLNRRGGQGTGYSVEQLVDPRFNLRLGLPAIAAAYALAWSPDRPAYEFLWAVAVGSGHPGQVPLDDPRIVRIFQVWACFSSGTGHYGPGGAPAAAFVPGPGQSLVQFAAALFAPGMPVPPGSVLGAHAGSLPAAVVAAVVRGTARRLIYSFSPRMIVRRQIRALTPAGLRARLVSAIDPRAQLRRAMKLPYPFAMDRLPPGHRHPRH